ncbi:hypothetical protein [Amycolatopsis sp. NPDC059657]|uniref:hypothetical protein n=1 Tax=Amycolatopsis sp. NPDC059657 TaxID=3346899 RepID=UPI003673313A
MATTEEIERRVAEADSVRSAKRSATAQRVGELAQRRDAIAEQLSDVERELGDVLAAAGDVIGVDELARFTEVPAADLTRWLTARTPTRTGAKRTRSAASEKNGTSKRPSVVRAPTDGRASTLPESSAVPRADADVPVGVAGEGT